MYLGEVLEMQRPFYAGHSPGKLSRQTTLQPNRSVKGEWLGRSIVREGFGTSFQWRHLKSEWYRANFDPFVASARLYPFFISWNPQDHPDEVLYAWTNQDISPSNMGVINFMQVSMDVEALA